MSAGVGFPRHHIGSRRHQPDRQRICSRTTVSAAEARTSQVLSGGLWRGDWPVAGRRDCNRESRAHPGNPSATVVNSSRATPAPRGCVGQRGHRNPDWAQKPRCHRCGSRCRATWETAASTGRGPIRTTTWNPLPGCCPTYSGDQAVVPECAVSRQISKRLPRCDRTSRRRPPCYPIPAE